MSPGLDMINAFKVSCGTRLAPRNSKASITCPFGFTAGAGSALGVSNCGRWPGWAGWATGGAGGVAGGAGGGVVCGALGIDSKGLGFGGVAGGVCCCGCGCAGGWPAGGCWAGGCWASDWADIAGQMEMMQKQAGITTRRRRLKNFMQAYLSTLRGYEDVETQVTVSQVQLRFQRWQA